MSLKYLLGYSERLQAQVRDLIARDRLGPMLDDKYAEKHDVRTDRALFDYTQTLKSRHMRNAEPLVKVQYDSKLGVIKHALGTHTTVSRVQGSKLKAKREIRIDALFREAPAEFLKMIVVHELAHLKQREHDKAFYQLCEHMEPNYHQLEFDLRLYLTQRDLQSRPMGAN